MGLEGKVTQSRAVLCTDGLGSGAVSVDRTSSSRSPAPSAP